MSKFVSEAVTAICEAKLRASDIQAAVQVGSLHHFFFCVITNCTDMHLEFVSVKVCCCPFTQ